MDAFKIALSFAALFASLSASPVLICCQISSVKLGFLIRVTDSGDVVADGGNNGSCFSLHYAAADSASIQLESQANPGSFLMTGSPNNGSYDILSGPANTTTAAVWNKVNSNEDNGRFYLTQTLDDRSICIASFHKGKASCKPKKRHASWVSIDCNFKI